MNRITVIATVHKENGAANSQALALILKRIAPEIIFVETPKEEMEQYFSSAGLESRAIALLTKYQAVNLVPVDIQVMSKSGLLRFRKLFKLLDSCCDEMAQSIHEKILQRVSSCGFYYLNSPDYIEAQAELEMQDERLVESQGDRVIRDLYMEWKDVQSIRESGMIEKIASYCKNERFQNAVFLVGAAHIHSLRGRITDRAHLFNNVEWVYGV